MHQKFKNPNQKQIQIACHNALQFIGSQSEQSVFYNGLIVAALKHIDTEGSRFIKQKAVAILLAKKSVAWSFSYGDSYPDDLDDTCIALNAMYQVTPEIITEEVLASITSILIANEYAAGGPYQTWILPDHPQQWHDIDVVVNSNIALFLSQFGIVLPKLQEYFDDLILQKKCTSQYYYHEIIVIYFLARAYTGVHKDLLISTILQSQSVNGNWGNPLFTALAVSSLIQLGVPADRLDAAIAYLLESETDGRWSSQPFFIESVYNDEITYSSCDAHVSACCVEALTLYLREMRRNQHTDKKIDLEHKMNTFITAVLHTCQKVFSHTSLLLQTQFYHSYTLLTAKDPTDEITMLSYNFTYALRSTFSIEEQTLVDLAALNILGWVGYSTYDAILDGENQIGYLPMAGLCIRTVSDITHHLIKNDDDYMYIDRILSGIATSTAWEYEHCKINSTLPDYGSYACLAEKSLGHALGPIIICLLCGQYDQAYVVEKFFLHYLIARQLNDDAHDWVEDLENGYINSVSTDILKAFQLQSGQTELDLAKHMQWLRDYFWQHHIDIVSETIIDHCATAREQLKKITILRDVTFLEQFLVRLEHSALQAVSERDSTRIFLAHFLNTTVLR